MFGGSKGQRHSTMNKESNTIINLFNTEKYFEEANISGHGCRKDHQLVEPCVFTDNVTEPGQTFKY